MPITSFTYDRRSGESLYALAEGGEEFNLAVEPEDRNRDRLTLWQGERYDAHNHLVAQSDPLRLSYSDDLEEFYNIAANVFGEKPWIREALNWISRVHQKRVREALEKIRKETADDPEYKALPGHEPKIFRTPEGYRMEDPGRANLIPLSNFTCRIVEDVVVDDGSGEADRFFIVEAQLGGRRRRFEVSSQAFDGLAWVPRHLGALASVEARRVRDLVTKAIRLESVQGLKEIHAYGHSGWLRIDSGQWVYLHADGAIVGEDSPPFSGRVVLSGKLARRKFPQIPTDLEEVRDAVQWGLDLWDLLPDVVSIPSVAGVYRSVLGDTDFSIHLFGPTGLGKTTFADLLMGFFGKDLGAKDRTNYESTAYSIERQAFSLKDQVVVLDDYLGTPEHQKILAFIGRVAANASGRGRLSSDGTVIGDRPPRGLIVSTGEALPVGASLNARILTLPIEEGHGLDLEDPSLLNEAQSASREGTLAIAMAAFIRWLAPRYEEIHADLEARRNALGRQIRGRVSHPRTAALYGDLQIGIVEWLEFAEQIGALDSEERAYYQHRAEEAVMTAILGQGPADPTSQLRRLLRHALATGQAHVRTPDSEPEGGAGELIGWIRADGLYLLGQKSLVLAKEIARALGEPFVLGDLSDQAIYQHLDNWGWLLSTAKSHASSTTTVRRKLDGEMRRVLHLKAEFLDEG